MTQGHLDARFSEATEPLPWADVDDALRSAELYWLTTIRNDGRPHVTPLVGLWVGQMFVFCTGPTEQKAHNLKHNAAVAVTTGVNDWQDGVDVVVEGCAERVAGQALLTQLADAYRDKYSGEWDFGVEGDVFTHPDGGRAYVFRVPADKVIAFAKSPHGQTTFRF